MISVTEKVNVVEIPISESKIKIPDYIKIHHKVVESKCNGDFISVTYAITNEETNEEISKKTKWVSVQRNGCPRTITVRSNYLKEFESIVSSASYIERKFVENISKGDFGKYTIFKFV